MIDRELVKGSISIMVMELLAGKDMYGYEIIKELGSRSGGVFAFKEGTLYPVLHTLEKRGFVFSYWEDTKLARKRKYYHLTESGTAELASRREQWQVFSDSMTMVLGDGANA